VDDEDFKAAAQRLSGMDHLGVTELQTLYKKERTAGRLYLQIADVLTHEAAANALRRNGREELGHAVRIGRAIAILTGAPFDATERMNAGYDVLAPASADIGLVTALIHGEQGGAADYERWAASETNAEVADLLLTCGREETNHAERLIAALAGEQKD
jgi:rubrerythrin